MAQDKSDQTIYSLENILSPSSWGRNGLFTSASIKAEYEAFNLVEFCKQAATHTCYVSGDFIMLGIGSAVGATVGTLIGGFGGAACGALIGCMIGFAVLACVSMVQSIQSEIARNSTKEPEAKHYAFHNEL